MRVARFAQKKEFEEFLESKVSISKPNEKREIASDAELAEFFGGLG